MKHEDLEAHDALADTVIEEHPRIPRRRAEISPAMLIAAVLMLCLTVGALVQGVIVLTGGR